MAVTKIKPVSSGAYTAYTGKATTGLPGATPLSHQCQMAVNLFNFAQMAYGASNTPSTRAVKIAAAVGVLLQYS